MGGDLWPTEAWALPQLQQHSRQKLHQPVPHLPTGASSRHHYRAHSLGCYALPWALLLTLRNSGMTQNMWHWITLHQFSGVLVKTQGSQHCTNSRSGLCHWGLPIPGAGPLPVYSGAGIGVQLGAHLPQLLAQHSLRCKGRVKLGCLTWDAMGLCVLKIYLLRTQGNFTLTASSEAMRKFKLGIKAVFTWNKFSWAEVASILIRTKHSVPWPPSVGASDKGVALGAKDEGIRGLGHACY